MVAHQGAINIMRFQDPSRAPGVLCGNRAAFAQRTYRAQRNILKITNGRGDEVDSAGLEWRVNHVERKHAAIAEFNQIRIAF